MVLSGLNSSWSVNLGPGRTGQILFILQKICHQFAETSAPGDF